MTGSIETAIPAVLNSRRFVPLCVTAALILRLAWVVAVRPEPRHDCAWYYETAVSISSGNGYSIDGRPTAYHPVGYPAFLALLFRLFGCSVTVGALANVALSTGILLISYRCVRILFSSELTARLTLAILAFHPNHIAYNSLLYQPCEKPLTDVH